MALTVTVRNNSLSVFTMPNKVKVRRGNTIEVPLSMVNHPRVAGLIRKGRLSVVPKGIARASKPVPVPVPVVEAAPEPVVEAAPEPEPVVEAAPEPEPEAPKTRRRRRRGRPPKNTTTED